MPRREPTIGELRYFDCELFQIGLQQLRRRKPRGLTPTEIRLASLVAEGLGPIAIAEQRGKDPRSIKNQLGKIYRKLGIRSDGPTTARVRLAIYWNSELFQIGLLQQGMR